MCCVVLAFTSPDLVWCCWHITKQIFHALLFDIEIIYPWKYNIQLRFASLNVNYLGRMIFDIKQKGMKYLLIIIEINKNLHPENASVKARRCYRVKHRVYCSEFVSLILFV